MKAENIFLAALDKPTPAERQAYLDSACGSDADLRVQLEGLLHSHEAAGSFLNAPLFDSAATTDGTEIASEFPADPDGEFPLDFLAPATSPSALGRIGPYEVTERIGRGGMGLVLKARDAKLNRVVAIKVLAPELATNPTARKRFEREAYAAAAVVHQHVVTIHAVDEDRLPYLVMECIDGQSLQQKIDREGHLELKEILRIGQQIAAGLAAAHAQGLMHRDVKPANILLENGVERVRITDFGLARAVDDVDVTRTGEVAGTPQYMSPEQAQGLPMDARSDLFSLGCVLYAMCTGRSPFRAETTFATVRRVCEDKPRPIRDVNPEIPQGLATLIDRLLAKQPSERFQSAAEVAELLSRQLAEVQHPSTVAPVAVTLRVTSPDLSHRAAHSKGLITRSVMATRLWTAAAVLLCAALLLGLSEAGGVTKVTTSVIRVLTPQGTLIIEVDDPGVTVTVEDNGGVVIKDAGPREVHLPVGKYTVRATKDGQPVKEEIVSISRNGAKTVRVLRERPKIPGTAAFVLLGGPGVAERKFNTLAAAVVGASDGDTIEIRGNGPFISEPINLQLPALTIRAGEGFRPVIKLSSTGVQRGSPLLFVTNATLTLEGLELHDAPTVDDNHKRVIHVKGAVLRAANCRFRSSIWTNSTPGCVFVNCEFLSDVTGEFLGHYSQGARFIFENCLHRGGGAALYFSSAGSASDEMSVQIKRSTFVNKRVSVWLAVKSPPAAKSDQPPASKPVRLEVSGCIFDTPSVLGFEQHKDFVAKAGAHAPAAAEALLLRLMQWRGERNVLRDGSTSVNWGIEGRKQPAHGPKSLEEWQPFWGDAEADPREGRLLFQDGSLRTRTEGSLDQVTPEDFRLHPDSAGYRAGKDGNDLGADVNLVGPGAAYERWKQTPEYRQWLKDSGQLKERADAQPQTGAFVLLGGTGVAERKFNTLVEAVQRANDGDTIVVRGNGPFLSQPINIQRTALAIRAGDGFRPVIKLRPEAIQQDVPLLTTNAALVLEGLELHRALPEGTRSRDVGRRRAVHAQEGALWAANCRFRAAVWVGGPLCVLRNCEVVGEHAAINIQHRPSSTRLLVDNCLHRTGNSTIYFEYLENPALHDKSIEVRRTTMVGGNCNLWLGLQALLPATGGQPPTIPPIRVQIAGSILDARHAMGFGPTRTFLEQPSVPQPTAADAALLRLLQWRGERNVFAAGNASVYWGSDQLPQPAGGPQSLPDWKAYWGSSETDTLEGRLRYQGGNLLSRTDLDQLTPGDFRLLEGSPGYRAGPDGEDLGADVDLVGPGEAYERWKKTPEYQQWLMETGQLKDRAAARPESGAFVVQGGAGVAERKFDTLAEAVSRASAGDTIEIRGNGPFVTDGVTIGQRLVIRAGQGHTPTITLSQAAADTNVPLLTSLAPLVLEGLELRRMGGAEGPFEGRYPILVKLWNEVDPKRWTKKGLVVAIG